MRLLGGEEEGPGGEEVGPLLPDTEDAAISIVEAASADSESEDDERRDRLAWGQTCNKNQYGNGPLLF